MSQSIGTTDDTSVRGTGSMKVIVNSKRDWEVIRDPTKLVYLLDKKLEGRALFLKYSVPPAEFSREPSEGGKITFYYAPNLPIGGSFTLYLTLNRQIELDFQVEEIVEPGHLIASPVEVRIGKAMREFPRIPVSDDSAYVTNFRVSKNEIAPNNTKLQITNQVIFADFEKRMAGRFPGMKIHAPYDAKFPDFLKDFEGHEGSMVNTPQGPGFAQPVVYESEAGGKANLAYMVVPGEVDPVGQQDLASSADEMIKRIIDANTFVVKDKQKVINISEGGIAILFTNEDLKKYVPLRRWITFDLIFKMQAPLRLHGAVRHMEELPPVSGEDEHVLAGLDFQGLGHTDFRKGSQNRLKSLLKMLAG
ncbi:MAG: DUF1577 domain-containing protein [Leptospiraceae bacterium]|nr:DUF1577 domain-containing protein [Leptospiraceae bacterium]